MYMEDLTAMLLDACGEKTHIEVDDQTITIYGTFDIQMLEDALSSYISDCIVNAGENS